jgi:hypothetical protein
MLCFGLPLCYVMFLGAIVLFWGAIMLLCFGVPLCYVLGAITLCYVLGCHYVMFLGAIMLCYVLVPLCCYFQLWPRRFNASETEAKRTQRSVKLQRTLPVIPAAREHQRRICWNGAQVERSKKSEVVSARALKAYRSE